jgi:hypothetical protein
MCCGRGHDFLLRFDARTPSGSVIVVETTSGDED